MTGATGGELCRQAVPRQAMILAAGEGMRLRPHTERVPKAMIPVGGKPLLEQTLGVLRAHGVADITINLYYLPRVVTDYFGDGSRWGVKITYSIEERPLGTAGGVKRVADRFRDPFFVWYGDNLSNCDLTRLYACHRAKGATATIGLFEREDPTASGVVGLDPDDRITRFLEKPRPEQVFSHWVSAGIFVLEPEVLAAIPAEGAPDFGRDVFPALLAAGRPLYGYRLSPKEGLWWIDTPADLRRTEASIAAAETGPETPAPGGAPSGGRA